MATRMWSVLVLCGAACAASGNLVTGVTDPPGPPAWWSDATIAATQAAGGTWGFVHSPDGTTANQERNSNLPSFDMSVIKVGDTDEVYVVLRNGYRPTWTKTFMLYITGETTDPAPFPPMDTAQVIGANNGAPSSTVTITEGPTAVTLYVGPGDTFRWAMRVEGTIRPQPDRVEMSFYIPGLVSIGKYWGGEYCLPTPGTSALLAAGGLVLAACRRR